MPADNAKILNPVVELAILIRMLTNEDTAKIKTHTLAAESKICSCSM